MNCNLRSLFNKKKIFMVTLKAVFKKHACLLIHDERQIMSDEHRYLWIYSLTFSPTLFSDFFTDV